MKYQHPKEKFKQSIKNLAQWTQIQMGKRIKYYKKPKPLSTTSFEPLSTTTKGGYTTNV